MENKGKTIDIQTGTVLKPGKPEECAGNGKEDPMTCCCDGCDYLNACYPADRPPERPRSLENNFFDVN